MKRFLALSVAILTLAACSRTATARYQLTMDITNVKDVATVTQQTINVMQRRLDRMGEKLLSSKSENTGSGKVIVTITAQHKEALNALSDQMKEPFDLEIMAEAQGKEKPDITVEKFGGFVKAGITGKDLSWVEADKEPGKDLGRVHLMFTPDGRTKMAALFKKMVGKNIGIFVRGQLISKLTVETDVLKDDIVIQDIPSLDIAKVFADDVNSGIHSIVTPLP